MFDRLASLVAKWTGKSSASLLAVFIVLVWLASGPFFHFSDTWQLVINTGTTIITFIMVFLIQNAQERGDRAMHLKLDELIKASKDARNALLGMEEKTEKEQEAIKEQVTKECGS